MQCMMGAMTSTAAATGVRAWVATREWSWLTPQLLRRVTLVLLVAAFVMSATVMSGSGGSG